MSGPVRRCFPSLVRAACGLAFAGLALGALAQDAQEAARLVRAGQYGPALERIEAVLAKNPRDAQARFLKGVVLGEQGKANDAIAVFQALTEDYPELPEPYNNLASLFAAKGQYEKAKTALEMAIQINPSYGTAFENLGDVYAKLASQAWDKAAQLDKGNVSAQNKLAAVRGAFAGSGKAAPKSDAAKPAAPASAAPAAPANQAPRSEAVKPAAAPVAVAQGGVATAPTAMAPGTPPASAAVAAVKPSPTAAPQGTGEVMAAVNAWVQAWSARNVDGYLSAYSKSFEPDGQTRDAWEATRRSTFPASKPVRVAIDQPHVNMLDANRAEVTFHQQFQSERVRLNTRKTLVLAREDGGWHIAKEHIVP